jgi:gliding motility-associated-like protein
MDDTIRYETDDYGDADYNWTVYGGNIIGSSENRSVQVHWEEDSDSFALQVDVVVYGNCEHHISEHIRIFNRDAGRLELTEYEGCPPFSPRLQAADTASINYILWNFDGMGISRDVNPSFTFTNPGTYNISLIVQNIYGCRDTCYHPVTVFQDPTAQFTVDYGHNDTIYDEEWFEIFNESVHGDFFRWYIDGDTIFTSDLSPLELMIERPGHYPISLVAETVNGCVDSTWEILRIDAEELLFVPNAFSPNGDGLNDYFYVVHRNIIAIEVRIYNRRGTILFSSDDIDFGWDGRYREEMLPEDAYVYKIQAWVYSGRRHHRYGTIHLIR